MLAKVTRAVPSLVHEKLLCSYCSLSTSGLAGCHTQGDLRSYVLKMTEPLPTWIPEQSLHEQKINLYCTEPLRFGDLCIIGTNIIRLLQK